MTQQATSSSRLGSARIDIRDDRVPSDFEQYWRALERPAVQRGRRVWQRLFGFDPIAPPELVRQLAHGYYDADPIAEAFVDEVYGGLGPVEGRRLLDQAIEHGVDSISDAPASMRALFAEFERVPDWVDWDLVDRGAALQRRYGPSFISFAGVGTLTAYTENSIAKPLALTGAYTGDTALNRFMETARFIIDFSNPDGLRPGGAGRATAMRVRVMHVFIRRRLIDHPEWDLEAWGVPISQSDALITLMAGSLVPAVALHVLGYRTTKPEIEAMMHHQRYTGHLLGVHPRWYPSDVREGIQLATTWLLKANDNSGADGIELIESYPRAFMPSTDGPWRKRLRDHVNYRAQLGYTRYFLPGSFYRRFDMPNPWPWALHPLLQAPFNLTVDLARRRSPAVARLQDRYASRRRETWWRNEMGDRQSKFNPVQQLRR